MTNAELIKALRKCGKSTADRCWNCNYYDREPWCESALANDAADALEAADKRIADLETALAACRARKWEQNIKPINPHGELREMLIDGMIDRMGEWLDEQRGRWIYAKCNLCGKVQDVRSNYCPNCGAKMDGETEHGNTYSLGKIEMPNGAMKQIIADGERKDGERRTDADRESTRD